VTNFLTPIAIGGAATPTNDQLPILWPINPFHLVWSNAPPGHHILTALATDNSGTSAKSDPVEIDIVQVPARPIVTVEATDPVASEGSPDPSTGSAPDTATFTIRRTDGTNFALTVYYRLGGTASNGVDYRPLPSSATIPEGERSVDVVVVPIDDQ